VTSKTRESGGTVDPDRADGESRTPGGVESGEAIVDPVDERSSSETNRVSIGSEVAYQATVSVVDQGGSSGALVAAFLTGLTLYVIPSWVTHEYTTTINLRDVAGNEIASKTYQHELMMIQQLFMIFGMPFADVETRRDQMWEAVMKDAAVWTVETLSR